MVNAEITQFINFLQNLEVLDLDDIADIHDNIHKALLAYFHSSIDFIDRYEFWEALHQARGVRIFLERKYFHNHHFLELTGYNGAEAEYVLSFIGPALSRKTRRSCALSLSSVFLIAMTVICHGGDMSVIGKVAGKFFTFVPAIRLPYMDGNLPDLRE